jgi:hypothetical protein
MTIDVQENGLQFDDLFDGFLSIRGLAADLEAHANPKASGCWFAPLNDHPQ